MSAVQMPDFLGKSGISRSRIMGEQYSLLSRNTQRRELTGTLRSPGGTSLRDCAGCPQRGYKTRIWYDSLDWQSDHLHFSEDKENFLILRELATTGVEMFSRFEKSTVWVFPEFG